MKREAIKDFLYVIKIALPNKIGGGVIGNKKTKTKIGSLKSKFGSHSSTKAKSICPSIFKIHKTVSRE